ncbi:MAG: DUF4388 domain-containing protein [Deltaproteobacteria bacterium]|nr:DUF4388 domain-containing protein [Deltaproteobacteria bacterium]
MISKSSHLIIAGDIPELHHLPALLSKQGYNGRMCLNGTEALHASVASPPRLLVLDMNLSVLSAPRLVRILRRNPKTAEIDIFIVGVDEQERGVFGMLREGRDAFIPRPFNREQLVSRIIRALKQFEEVEPDEGRTVIEGNLSQMSLVDLLQVFNLNRKDGLLTLKRGKLKGKVHLLEGNVINAQTGSANGEKAFFRLLSWTAGNFHFVQGTPRTEIRIQVPTDYLIMEGLRQKDEMDSMADSLPSLDAVLKLRISRENLPKGLRPSTQEVINLLEYYDKVEDILDKASPPDFEVLHILKVLIDKKILECQQDSNPVLQDNRPLLNPADVVGIRDCLGEKDLLLEEGSAKIIVLYSSPADLHLLLETLKGIREFDPDPEMAGQDNPFRAGNLGRLHVGEVFSLRFFCLSAAPEAAPLWSPFSRRMIGVLSLPPHAEKREAEAFFRNRKVPVVRVTLQPGRDSGVRLYPGGRGAWRRLLASLTAAFLTNCYAGRDEK